MLRSDSIQPLLFRITVDATGLGGAAPQDGFVDLTKTAKYMDLVAKEGDAAPSMNDGDKIKINQMAIEFVAGSLNLAGVISTINALTHVHHVIASDNGVGYLKLENAPGFEGIDFFVDATDPVLTRLGWASPNDIAPADYPTDLNSSRAKERGNMRWEAIKEQLADVSTPFFVEDFRKVGGDIDTEPSEIGFTVAYSMLGHVYTFDETNNNEIIEGLESIKRKVARALVNPRDENRVLIDPTLRSAPSGEQVRNGGKTEFITAAAIAGDLATAEANITVTPITNSR